MKNVEIPKFWSPPGLLFSGQGQKIIIPLPTFLLPRLPISKKVWHNPPATKPLEEIDLAENTLFGVRAWPQRASGYKYPDQKLLAQKLVENLTPVWPWGQKLFHIVAVTDRQTVRKTDGQKDRQTDAQFKSPRTPKGKFFSYIILCPAKFLPFHYQVG